MMKRIITVIAFAACLALCAAVWPQKQPVGETPAPSTPATVIATQPEVPKMPEMKDVTVCYFYCPNLFRGKGTL